MTETYYSGIAFILEGDTEKVFYGILLGYFVRRHSGTSLEKINDPNTGETFYILNNNNKKIQIKYNVVGTVSQITNSAKWFESRCYNENKQLNWTVFLCYDTDSYKNDITKFNEGDWKELKKSITRHKKCQVIDLAAQADIEDIFLIDADGIFSYLDIPIAPIPSGKKGKSKLKKIFRSKGNGFAYHEGERAREFILSLDLEKIIELSPINFCEIEKVCFENI